MDNSSFILLYWRKEQKEFKKNFEILRSRPDKNAVHDIRVSIKKLRACLKLYSLIGEKDKWQTLFTETKKLFSILGKERDIEVCIELISGYEQESGENLIFIKDDLKLQLRQNQRWSQEVIKKYTGKELAKIEYIFKQDTSLSQKEWIEKTIDCINSLLQEIKKYYKKPHQTRKILKDIYYWIKMLPEDSIDNASFEKEINKMLDDFGNWQNDEILLMLIKHFRKDYLPVPIPEYDSFKTFEKKIEEKKERILKAVIHKTKQLPKKISLVIIKKAIQ